MVILRETLEEHEHAILQPYALFSGDSRGRQFPDHRSTYRTEFQRDRDRILHAAAFRRLEYKTQVFVNDAGDYYRTRLTHTLEVAQIGRTIARALGANEDLVEAICLAHDLGHPPFGHSGEEALNRAMDGHGGFNHNYQSYRIITELEHRYPDWNGLNLTVETLDGIAKHETSFDWEAVVDLNPNTRGSLEAQIADMSDGIAYNAHDLDDGLQADVIHVPQLQELEIWREICDRVGWAGEYLQPVQRHLMIRELVGMSVNDVIEQTSANIENLKPNTAMDIQEHYENVVSHSDGMQQHSRNLKQFLYANMYYHHSILRMKRRAERFVEALFESYVADPRQLPPEFFVRLEKDDTHRVVADYIASMTDRSALLEYRSLFDPMMRQ